MKPKKTTTPKPPAPSKKWSNLTVPDADLLAALLNNNAVQSRYFDAMRAAASSLGSEYKSDRGDLMFAMALNEAFQALAEKAGVVAWA